MPLTVTSDSISLVIFNINSAKVRVQAKATYTEVIHLEKYNFIKKENSQLFSVQFPELQVHFHLSFWFNKYIHFFHIQFCILPLVFKRFANMKHLCVSCFCVSIAIGCDSCQLELFIEILHGKWPFKYLKYCQQRALTRVHYHSVKGLKIGKEELRLWQRGAALLCQHLRRDLSRDQSQ